MQQINVEIQIKKWKVLGATQLILPPGGNIVKYVAVKNYLLSYYFLTGKFPIIQTRLIKHSYLIFHLDDLNYISHVGNKHEIGDFEKYNHLMHKKDDFSLLKDDMMGSYFRNLFSLKKSIFVRTSNEHWIRNFYLPYL